MRLGLNTALALLKAGVRYTAPAIFYPRKFNTGDPLVPKDVETGNPVDLPRFDGDTLIRVLGGFPLQVVGHSRGEYSSTDAAAEFVHSRFGRPHYEVKVCEYGGAFSNYGKTALSAGSLFHIDAQLADERLELVPVSQKQVA